jgi:hypothetical protein
MSRVKKIVVLSAIVSSAILQTISSTFAAGGEVKEPREGGYVVRCSLDGVNPVHHPEIFGNAATAKSYGFFRDRNGTWQVAPSCRR